MMDGINVENVEVTYTQEQDTCGLTPEWPTLKMRMARMDGGDDDFYIVMQTDGFAFNDAAELTALVEDFIKRCKNDHEQTTAAVKR